MVGKDKKELTSATEITSTSGDGRYGFRDSQKNSSKIKVQKNNISVKL